MAEVLFRAKLQRRDSSTPWGFRLQGGVEYNKPLTLLKVVTDSIASKGGLHAGDIVVKLCGKSAEGMTHKDAQQAILTSGNSLEIIVERAEATLSPPTSSPASPPLPVPALAGAISPRHPDQVSTLSQDEAQNHIGASPSAEIHAAKSPEQLSVPPEDPSHFVSSDLQNHATNAQSLSPTGSSSITHQQNDDCSIVRVSSSKETKQQTTMSNMSTVHQSPAYTVKNDIPNIEKLANSGLGTSTNSTTATDSSLAEQSTSHVANSSEPKRSRPAESESKEERLLVTANETKPSPSSVTSASRAEGDDIVTPSSNTSPAVEQRQTTAENSALVTNSCSEVSAAKAQDQEPPDPGPVKSGTKGTNNNNNNTITVDNNNRRSSRPGFIEDPLALLKAPDPWPAASEVILKPVKKSGKVNGEKNSNEPTEAQVKQRELTRKQKEADELREAQKKRDALQKQKEKEKGLPAASLSLSSPSTPSSFTTAGPTPVQQQDAVHPWRRARPSSAERKPSEDAESKLNDSESARAKESMTPTLTFVGSRIESSSSPVKGVGFYTYGPDRSQLLPSIEVTGSYTAPISHAYRHEQGAASQPPDYEDYPSPRSEDIFFSTADPDLVGIPMPAVKEMVADLNRRLEVIAEQHPKIAQPANPQELGLSFAKTPESKEIFIDTQPVTIEDFKHRLFAGDAPGVNSYQKLYDVSSPVTSPFAGSFEKSFPFPGDRSPRGQRRVTFADPVESSVIEIEPRSRRPRRGERRRDSPEPEMESPSSLTEKLDRIERENALAAASSKRIPISHHEMRRSEIPVVHEQHGVQPEPRTIIYGAPPPYREDVYAAGKDTASGRGLLLSAPAGRGISVSLGREGPAQISFSIQHEKGGDHPSNPAQMAFSFPSNQPAQQITYSISPRAADSGPMSFSYSIPSSQRVSPGQAPPAHGYTKSWDDSKTIHITYPPQPVPGRPINTAAGPLSPPRGSPVPYNLVGVRPYSQPVRSLSPPVVSMRSLSPPIVKGRSVSPPAGLTAGRPVQVNRAPSPIPRIYAPPPYAPPTALQPDAAAALDDMSQSRSFKVLEAKMSDGGKDSAVERLPLRVSVDPDTVRVAPHTVPQPVASARRYEPSSPVAGGGGPGNLEPVIGVPAVHVTQAGTPFIPQVAQELLSSPAMERLSASGLFAFFDKSFAEKFIQWKSQQSAESPTQTPTQRLVHEMDENEKRGGGST